MNEEQKQAIAKRTIEIAVRTTELYGLEFFKLSKRSQDMIVEAVRTGIVYGLELSIKT